MKKTIDIVGKRNIFFTFSAILIVISLGSLFINGLNFGIDFIGGTIIQIELNQTFETNEIREITDKFDESASITNAGDNQTQLIIDTKENLTQEEIDSIYGEFEEKYDADIELLNSDYKSATIGNELRRQSLIAVAVAVLLMMAYISFRFQFSYAMAALLALLHDIVIVLGVYSLFNIPVNTAFIAAILTILGYSVNDTIVVFDRVRENRKKYKKSQLAELVNDSVSQTMPRSINTTLTTLLAITALYLMGVQAIQSFTLPLMVGFVSGAYSSIFIANSFWYVVQEKKVKSSR
ncbi:protein translocase subunit SecF [Alkalibaculum sp. M08DMB]|uniref:Protein-export membrane protein SecF n=1 Tax=Alkalibaculum sporogenes TaxID=2655001 RepID=A0A6A7K552_9FIRM|nr:protein translocase subunit SecF [Alkalibaculum sporogenes]MPW24562.1 protein translocase subunit SecF [Alkalibaculum sporogenes]